MNEDKKFRGNNVGPNNLFKTLTGRAKITKTVRNDENTLKNIPTDDLR